ncbi:protein DBF4 homolog A [Patella vulgata]|uniref:protein DBF4 homolog A n=1 Tax=Patella vulgata TaxID=6465 RepID=UPI00217FF1B2|nr:protein DBF4 homolog A [Patella vulgata]
METADDGVARRKLNFGARSFANKTFYVDVRSVSVRNKVVKHIHDLGGNVETFLGNDIHVFVTDTKNNKRQDRVRELSRNNTRDGSSYPDSPSPGGSCLPLSRGKALLLKARGNGSENSSAVDRGLSSNVMIQKATEMGLKIEHVHTFLKKCKTLTGSSKIKSKRDTLGDIVPLTWDNDIIVVKIEDASKSYKPLHKQFSKLPMVYADNGGGSPFDGPVVLEKPECVKSFKKAKSTRFYTAKGGYCEMCDFYFKNSLKEHLLSEKHLSFVDDESNFKGIETVVDKLPNISKFLSKFCINPRPANSINPVDPSGPTIDKRIEDENNNTNEIVMEKEKESSEKTEINDDVVVPMEDEEQDFTSSDTIIYDFQDQYKGDNSILPPSTKADAEAEPNNVEYATNMFSDDSQQDSQTDVLKDLIHNWTLSEAPNISSVSSLVNFDVMSCGTHDTNEHKNIVPGKVVPGLPKPVGVEPSYSDSEPEVGMSFSTPRAEENSSSGEMPLLSPQLNRKQTAVEAIERTMPVINDDRVKPQKRKHDDVLDECVYYTKKTDDTKLKIKLCKVTPARQKTNLKMFWKVRKTGECRLVFSAGKSKKPLGESNDLNSNIHENSPSRKRQRTLNF